MAAPSRLFVAACVALATATNLFASAQTAPHTNYTLTYKEGAPVTVGADAGTVVDLALDLFVPTGSPGPHQLIVYVHGGAWFRGSRDILFDQNANVADRLLGAGFALASMSYRLSGVATFPAQIQDINDAINYLYDNAGSYNIAVDSIAIFGGSAGGHLASLVAASNEHEDTGFYEEGREPKYDVSACLSIFGPQNFHAMRDNCGQGLVPNETIQNLLSPCTDHDSTTAAEGALIGYSVLDRPDLGAWVSPSTYVTPNTPPYLMFHGSLDLTVYFSQSHIMSAELNLAGVEHEYFIAEGVGHGRSDVFDADPYLACGFEFLSAYSSGEVPDLQSVCVGDLMRSGRVTVDTANQFRGVQPTVSPPGPGGPDAGNPGSEGPDGGSPGSEDGASSASVLSVSTTATVFVVAYVAAYTL